MANESAAKAGSGGMGCCTVLFFIFLTLKLCDKIDWSWWWVTSPLWLPWCLLLPILGIAAIIAYKLGMFD